MLGFGHIIPKLRQQMAAPALSFFGLFGTPNIGCSLRNLGGPLAVRVLRSSDSTLSDFSPSQIGTDGGEMLAWVNEDVNLYTSDFSGGVDGFTSLRGTVDTADGIFGEDDVLRFTLNADTGQHLVELANIFNLDGCDVAITAKVYIPSGQTTDGVRFWTGNGADGLEEITTTDSWVDASFTLNPSGNDDFRVNGLDGASFSYGSADGDVFYLKDIVITQTEATGSVHTFYDQTGNYDFTQTTVTAQPLIVNQGALVTENGLPAISGNGTTQYLTLGGTEDAGLLGDLTIYIVCQAASNTDTIASTGRTATSNANEIQWGINRAAGVFSLEISNGTTEVELLATSAATGQSLITVVNDESGSVVLKQDGSVEGSNGATAPMNDMSLPLELMRDPFRASLYLNGTIQEFIGYNEVKDNVTDAEANIIDYYGI